MVWALRDPSTFGQFFPDGEYVGYDEVIDTEFTKLSPEKRREYDNHIVTFQYRISQKFTKQRGELTEFEKPRIFKLVREHKNLASLILLNDRLTAVDQAMKEVIEHLEPDTHQLWPLDIRKKNGRPWPNKYYGLVIRHFKDSFLPEQSDASAFEVNSDGIVNVVPPYEKSAPMIGLSRQIIGDSHLWRELTISRLHIFMSDKMKEEINRLKLKTPKLINLKEV